MENKVKNVIEYVVLAALCILLFFYGMYFNVVSNYYVMALAVLFIIYRSLAVGHLRFDINLCFFTISASLFIISILEELAPFGPGTRCYILWLIWGLLLVNDNKEIKIQDKKPKSHYRYIRNM